MDGVNGITECPIAPGFEKTYTFRATQYGTSWYHSHYSAQYGDGLVGAIQINGPASANYDHDASPVMISDWYYSTIFEASVINEANLKVGKAAPNPDTILINGRNKDTNGNGAYFVKTVKPRAKTRIRLINTSVDSNIRVSIDGHALQVITSDFVPIQPIMADSVLLAIGQRYDVIIEANQMSANYWMRAVVEGACASKNNGTGLAIINYEGSPVSEPTTLSTAVDSGCTPPGALIPYVYNKVGNATNFIEQVHDLDINLYVPGMTAYDGNIVTWGINMTGMQVQWDIPTMTYLMNGSVPAQRTQNIVQIPAHGTWTYWIIQEAGGNTTRVPIPHPIHLHGHDFYILGTGLGIFDPTTDPAKLTYDNPTRRDTTFLPARGWLAIAFPADNPGAWLLHCHIAWHIAGGLGLEFVYPPNTITRPEPLQYTRQCNAWRKYYKKTAYNQTDSGL